MFEHIAAPITIAGVTIPNRTVMAAMGNHLANADGTASQEIIDFYAARAKGGTGLIITACACVDMKTGRGDMGQLGLDDDKYIPGLASMADAVHAYGSKLAVQIYHPGRQGIAALNGVESMMSPSATECQCVHQPTHAMSREEIRQEIRLFIDAAERLKRAGVDIVELHGAHGYLIDQFLSPYTNHRTDEYGGSFENRMRFLDEIIDGIRERLGDYPIFVRFSVDEHLEYCGKDGEGIRLEDGIMIARHLEAKGVDALDVSCGIYESMNTAWEPVGFDQGWKIQGPAAVKNAVTIPVIGAAVIRDPEYAEEILEQEVVDMVASARSFLADPEWTNKSLTGHVSDIRKCISCLYCMESLMAADQTPNPMCCAINFEGCRETQYSQEKLVKDGDGRKVVVVGAGPAGMEAARILALRGFHPILMEKTNRLGGQVVMAARPPQKEKMEWLIDYQQGQLEKLGVEIHLNTEADPEQIKAMEPYAQSQYSAGKEKLSKLRNSIGRADMVETYPFLFEWIPAELLGTGSKLSDEEKSVIYSLQYYSLLQQGKSACVHYKSDKYQNVGTTLAKLRAQGESESIDRRFNTMILSDTGEEFLTHLRYMLQIYKAKDVTGQMDFAQLAADIYSFLHWETGKSDIRLSWSREYYKIKVKGDNNND